MTRDDVVAAARDWVGVPWRHQGRNEQGVDCIGLVIKIGEAFGVHYEDRFGYAREPNGLSFLNHLRQYLTHVEVDDTRPGTIGVFRQVRFPCHVGIFAVRNGIPTLINSRVDRGSVVEENFIPDFGALRLVERLAFPGLE